MYIYDVVLVITPKLYLNLFGLSTKANWQSQNTKIGERKSCQNKSKQKQRVTWCYTATTTMGSRSQSFSPSHCLFLRLSLSLSLACSISVVWPHGTSFVPTTFHPNPTHLALLRSAALADFPLPPTATKATADAG